VVALPRYGYRPQIKQRLRARRALMNNVGGEQGAAQADLTTARVLRGASGRRPLLPLLQWLTCLC
jgi:hypothetical protein